MKTINKIKVENMDSLHFNSMSKVANQFIIYTDEGTYFQSYNSLIVFIEKKTGKIYLDKNAWDYSRTTGKYRNKFLCEDIKETRRKIKEGVYKLVNLN